MFVSLLLIVSVPFLSAQGVFNGTLKGSKLFAIQQYQLAWGSGYSANPAQLNSAGIGFYGTQYLARATVQGSSIPGRGYFIGGKFRVHVTYNGKEVITNSCQTLMLGNFMWVPLQTKYKIPSSAVIAGYDSGARTSTYFCRGYVYDVGRDWLMPGKLLKGETFCRIPHWGETKATSFDILVTNY